MSAAHWLYSVKSLRPRWLHRACVLLRLYKQMDESGYEDHFSDQNNYCTEIETRFDSEKIAIWIYFPLYRTAAKTKFNLGIFLIIYFCFWILWLALSFLLSHMAHFFMFFWLQFRIKTDIYKCNWSQVAENWSQ